VLEAGKIIVAVSIILWVLASYGPGDSFERAEERATAEAEAKALTKSKPITW
jgi:ferrous iron transport protein B